MRRGLRILAWGMGTLSLLAVLLGGAVFIAGNTGPGRALLERLTYRLTSGHVGLSGLAGAFPGELFVEHLQLSDARGVWLRGERVTLHWSVLAGFTRRLQIDSLHAASVDMQRLPESSSDDQHRETPSIPRIDVAGVAVDVVTLGAELAGAPASLTLRGNAHLRSLEDMIIDASAHRIGGDGDYELRLKFDTRRMDALLTLHEPAGGPLENLLGLPGLGALQATLNLSGPRAAEQFELSIDAGALRGRAHGSFDLTHMSGDFEFAFDSPALTPRPDIAWQRASAHGHWHGSLMAPQADAQVEFDQLRVPGEFRMNTLRAELGSDTATATLHALIGGLRIPGSRPQLLKDSALTIDAALRLDQANRPLDVQATHRLFNLHATTEVAGAWDGKRAALELRLPNLADLAALGVVGLRGSALLKAQLRNDGPATHMLLDASAALAPQTQVWSGAVGNRATLQLSGAISASAVTIDSMKFAGRTLSLTANGELSLRAPGPLHARWSLDATDLAAWSPALAGTLNASGTLDGPVDALAAQAQLTSTLAVHGASAGMISAAVTMRGLPSAPTGALLAQGSFDGAPVHLDLAMERTAGGTLRALVRRADWKSARLDGEIGFTPAGTQALGQLHMEIGQLADLQRVLGTKVGGSVAGSVQFRPGQGRTHAQLQVDARDLTVGPWAGNAQLSAEGGADALAFKLELQIPDWRGAPASLSANGSLNVPASALSVAQAAAHYRGQDVHLLAPARIALANGIAVEALKLGAHGAVFELDGRISPALSLRASLRGVDPALVNGFAPGALSSGTIEAHAELAGSLDAPTGEIRLSALDMRLADDAALGLPPFDIQADAKFDGDGANIDARLAAGSASRLSVTGHAPFADEGDYDLKVDGNLNVGMINPLLEAHGQHAAGELTIHATVAGQIAAPQIDGSVNLSKGSLRDYARGLSLTNISAAIAGSEGRLRIDSLTATAAPGTVSMTGTVGVLQSGMPVDLHIKADNAQPLASNLVTANLNADLHVTGALRQRLEVAGSVQLNRTLIGIPSSLPPNVGVLDVRRRGKSAVVIPEHPLVIGLDVAVSAREILLQGRGLNAEVGGELHIGGTADTPFVSGGFDLQRGTFSLASSNLNFITPGSVSFNGAGLKNKIDPTLDLTAQTTTSDGTVATLHITGLVDSPQFEFTSNPPYPQDEIMARLLYGVPGAQLSGLQLAQIGVTLASLSGVGGDSGLNPLVKLQRSLGLDRLNVGAATTNTAAGTENTGASIEAGRYITKRVFVVARQTTTGNAQVEAHVDLTKHLKLQTRLGNGTATVVGTTPENDPGSSIGLSYQIEY